MQKHYKKNASQLYKSKTKESEIYLYHTMQYPEIIKHLP